MSGLKTRLRTSQGRWIAALCVLAAAGLFPAALPGSIAAAGHGRRTAAPPYQAIDLGRLGASSTKARFVNETGQIVGDNGAYPTHLFSWTKTGGMVDLGSCGNGAAFLFGLSDGGSVICNGDVASGDTHAFRWTQAGGFVDLGTLGGTTSAAYAQSEAGRVVGSSFLASGRSRAYSWTQAGGMANLGTLGGTDSTARAVNESGRIVGQSSTAAGRWHPFSWTQTDGMVDLGVLTGFGGDANAVNEAGQIVGWISVESNVFRAFSWTQAGGMIELGTLGGVSSVATRVNDLGQVVGYITTASGSNRAFSWTEAGGMVELGTLGGSSSYAYGLSDSGQVVGTSTTSSGATHAFFWTATGGMVDLGTLGGTRSGAYGLNNSGVIVGSATTASGETHAVMWQLDASPPVVPSRPDLEASTDSGASDGDDVTNATTLLFTGTAETSSTVTLYRGPLAVGTASADATTGIWSIGEQDPLGPDGDYAYSATATNAGGIASPHSAPLVVTIDRSAPARPSAPDLAALSDTGASNSDDITTLTALTFTGTAEGGSAVTLLRGGIAVGTAVAEPGSGAWTIGDTVPGPGVYGFVAVATDVAGNLSPASTGLTVTVVACSPPTPPAVVAATAGDGRALVSFSQGGDGGAPITLYTVTAHPGGQTANGASSPIWVSQLTNGIAYTFTVTATNVAGAGPASQPSASVVPSATAESGRVVLPPPAATGPRPTVPGGVSAAGTGVRPPPPPHH